MLSINNTIASQEFDQLQLKKLLKNNSFEILSISLEQGHIFPEHVSPTDAVLVLLEGEIEFHILGEKYILQKLQIFDFPAKTVHKVSARKDSKFIIIR
ncbi:MAG: cupin domain-containing protein [Muriicola sp.]|nr:cupin domain-containing protein [Muriicola sp.]NNK12341.1 cupin domain-containing protein [Flavobacteriaceae bacterium]